MKRASIIRQDAAAAKPNFRAVYGKQLCLYHKTLWISNNILTFYPSRLPGILYLRLGNRRLKIRVFVMIHLLKVPALSLALFLPLVATPAADGQKFLRVAFGDRGFIPAKMLNADDLVWTAKDLDLGSNSPQMRLCKFTDTSRMTPRALAQRKQEGFNWVCYDDEDGKSWPTPGVERKDPTKFTILAAKLAHAAGFKFLAEPNFDLLVGRTSHGQNGRLVLSGREIPCVQLKKAGPYLDAISLQLQRAQADQTKYAELTRRYAKEMRAVNPRALVFVQVTSRAKSGKQSTAADLMPAIESVAPCVDGIWIHVDSGQDEFATRLLGLLARAGYRRFSK